MRNFDFLFLNHTNPADYVSQKWTHFPFIYDEVLQSLIDAGKPLSALEIGVQNGGSLQIIEKYLPVGSQIHGIDINPDCANLQFSKNIHLHIGDAADEKFIASTFKDINFDLIIDDGSHQSRAVINTFSNLFPKLKGGGIYLIEDMEHSYYAKSGGGFRKPQASIEFFKRLVDTLNVQFFSRDDVIDNMEVMKFLRGYASQIKRISFYSGVCAVQKYYCPKTIPFQIIKSGKVESIHSLPHRKTEEQLADSLNVTRQMFRGKEEIE
jgi:SAM-dependent methyltransferase